MNVDLSLLSRDDDFCVDVGTSIWLMDNHKWALVVWETFWAEVGGRLTLAHLDYHWDGGYDFACDKEKENQLLNADLGAIQAFVEEEEWIRYDSFIAPAVARGMFDCVHFYCIQGDKWDVAIDPEVLASTGTHQVIHESPETLATLSTDAPLIFDLCLDLFNRTERFGEGDLWSDAEILQFLEIVRPLIINASLVTVSLSFDCSGTADDTRHLAALVLPKIEEWRVAAANT
jgi:hypothetical protein